MIRTGENIVDPVAFVQENKDILSAAAATQGSVILCGADLDVHLSVHDTSSEHEIDALSTSEEVSSARGTVNNFLGSLYEEGSGSIYTHAGSRAYLTWYPSPANINDLQQNIGLKPGSNALRFVHGSDQQSNGVIPPRPYVQHFADGEYPQSTMPHAGIFLHDRNYDHAPGALLMPEVAVLGLKKIAQHTLNKRLFSLRSDTKVSRAAEQADRSTHIHSLWIDHFTHDEGELVDEGKARLAIHGPYTGNEFHRRVLSMLYDNGVADANKALSAVEKARYMQQEIYAHLVNIQPALQRVREERATDTLV